MHDELDGEPDGHDEVHHRDGVDPDAVAALWLVVSLLLLSVGLVGPGGSRRYSFTHMYTSVTNLTTHPQVPQRQHPHHPQHDAEHAPADHGGGRPVPARQQGGAADDGGERDEDVGERHALLFIFLWVILGGLG